MGKRDRDPTAIRAEEVNGKFLQRKYKWVN